MVKKGRWPVRTGHGVDEPGVRGMVDHFMGAGMRAWQQETGKRAEVIGCRGPAGLFRSGTKKGRYFLRVAGGVLGVRHALHVFPECPGCPTA